MSAESVTISLLTLGVLGATAAGAWLGGAALPRLRGSILAAFAAGAALFLLFDLLKESAGLGQGLIGSPLTIILLVVCFALGALLMGALSAAQPVWSWVLGIGLHGAAEGWILGTEAASADLTRIAGIASFLIHKGIEALTIPILVARMLSIRELAIATLALAGVTLAGALAGLWLGNGDGALWLFAAGAGATSFVILRLARGTAIDAWHALAMIAGAMAVFGAGLLHEL